MNENSITNYRCNSQFQLPQPPKLRAESCLFDKLPLELLCEIFKHLEEQDRYKSVTACLKWKNCIIFQSIYEANSKVVSVAMSLCKVVPPKQKELLEKIATDCSILKSHNLPSTRTRFDVKFTQMIECMATLELDDLDLRVSYYLNEKRETRNKDHGEIVFEAILKKIDPLPDGAERTKLLTEVAQKLIQCDFALDGLKLANWLLSQEGFEPLEIVAMFCEEGLVDHLISFLKNVQDPQIIYSLVAEAACLLIDNGAQTKFEDFLTKLSDYYKNVALYGVVLGSARSGYFDRALYFFKKMPNQDHYLRHLINDLGDLPERQRQFRGLFESIELGSSHKKQRRFF